MKKSEKFVSTLLLLILVILLAAVGTFGYMIFKKIMGDDNIHINFSGEKGYPVVIEHTETQQGTTNNTIDQDIFNGVNSTSPSQDRYKHFYNQLDDNAKIIYNKLYENRENLKTRSYTVEFGKVFTDLLSQPNGSEELKKQYQSAIEVLMYENPDIFYLDATHMYINIEKITKITGVTYNVYINRGTESSYLAEGFYTKEDVDRCQQQIEQVKDYILTTTNGKSDYEKIKIVHDYLVDNIQYESTLTQSNIYNLYGALVSKRSVCEGYAKAFQYLMNEIGIDNVIAIGTGTNNKNETENHAWNYVKLNGKWYAVDTTWDDPVIIGGSLTNSLKYKYFLKGSKTINSNHTISGKFTEDGQIFTYPTLSIEDYK